MDSKNPKKKLNELVNKAKQSANQISNKAKEKAAPKEKKPLTAGEKRRRDRKIWAAVGTVCLVGVLTMAIFVGIFMHYINTTMKGHVELDLSEYTQEVSTELYYKDPATDEWVMYQTLFANQNRIWVDSENIPDYLKKATVAIEDKRFETHGGVDWKGTIRAILSTVGGDSVQGGSTITQQLIKNITGDNENTIRRKITEIYRAMALEDEGYSKDEILTIYLNTIFLGNQCYGVKTASEMYFGKDVSELTLAECASLISITNNPSQYDPLRADWCREENRNRQLLVLDCMLDQGMIDQATHDAAVEEEIVFTDGWTSKGNRVTPIGSGDGGEEEVVSTANNSYYTDAVIEDVAYALVDLYGLKDDPADPDGYVRTAFEKAVTMVYGKGLKIYTAQNPVYQEIAENVFENTDYADYTDSYDQPLQAAITVVDPYNGDVVAMVGGTGAKVYDRSWNWATEVRQCGSAIKPVSTYAPALDNGTIHLGSSIDDYPIDLYGYGAYPKNSYGEFDGMISVEQAVRVSSNCAAVKVNQKYGVAESYNFMTEKLGFTTLTFTDSEQVGNMALGGLEVGVSTEEMAAAYAAFVNDGIYTKPRTFLRVLDNSGKVLIENESQSHVAMKEITAYQMRELLQTVVSSGTGTAADFSGMATAGKTGTTDTSRDRYFAGFTPYYCAAVWCGYKSNEEIYTWDNPSAVLWREVMERIHEELPYKDFNSCSGMTTVSVCADSGLLATDACTKDLRGSRVRSVEVAAQYAPKEACNMHKMVDFCLKGQCLAGKNCKKEDVTKVAVLDYDRPLVAYKGGEVTDDNVVKAADHVYLLKVISKIEKCPVHLGKNDGTDDPLFPWDPSDPNKPDPNDPTDPSNPTDPNDPTDPTDPSDPTDPDNGGEGGGTGDEGGNNGGGSGTPPPWSGWFN